MKLKLVTADTPKPEPETEIDRSVAGAARRWSVITEIRVKQKHINRKGMSCANCPVALAIGEVLVFDAFAYVDVRAVTVYDGAQKPAYKTPLPASAQGRLEKYDTTGEMRPFSFKLDIPAELLREKT